MSKAKKHYQQMHKKTIKDIKKVLKEAGPWDYGFIIEILHLFLVEMTDYYANDYNVCAMEVVDKNVPSRYEICKHLLELYENIEEDSKSFWSYFSEYYQYLWD